MDLTKVPDGIIPFSVIFLPFRDYPYLHEHSKHYSFHDIRCIYGPNYHIYQRIITLVRAEMSVYIVRT
jgi:hypothetical protein